VYTLVALLEGLVTALVVRALLAVRADLVQVAHVGSNRYSAPDVAP
jgi:hypothetical protein